MSVDVTTKVHGVNAGDRFLSFSLGTQEFAVPLLCVKEVIAVPELTGVPFTPGHFLGIMNLRGQVISVLDLRKKLEIKPLEASERAVIICDLAPLVLGVLVDSVNSVLAPAPGNMSPKPDVNSNRHADLITAVYRRDRQLVLFLDIDKALDAADYRAIENGNNSKAAA